MNLQLIELSSIESEELDGFLSQGWFRAQQTIFTTDVLYFDGQLYNAIWLRVRLQDFVADKKYKFLSKKNNKFSTEIKKAVITPIHEALYARYKEGISFEGAPSLHSLLNGNSGINVFNTYMIDVYDGNLLIGTGCFDLGSKSAAGIYAVYDPAYKKFSLGKYMIYEKMMFCKNKNLIYFYPGYVVPGYNTFDYKLRIAKPAIDFLDAKQKQWYPVYKY